MTFDRRKHHFPVSILHYNFVCKDYCPRHVRRVRFACKTALELFVVIVGCRDHVLWAFGVLVSVCLREDGSGMPSPTRIWEVRILHEVLNGSLTLQSSKTKSFDLPILLP